jgi:hypothetical protein
MVTAHKLRRHRNPEYRHGHVNFILIFVGLENGDLNTMTEERVKFI